jgi:endonuclease/exonuclease/phosphatase family metal-dependent hydrolase
MAGIHQMAFALDDGRTVGLATLSRFPLSDARVLPLTRFDLNFRSRDRIALAATFDTPLGALPTYNVHLDTRINRADRVEQVSGVLNDLAAAGARAIVAGDFNTNQHLWLFHLVPLPFLGRQGGALEAFMASHGLRSAFADGATHDALGMRLDWVFLKGLVPMSTSIHPVEISDHHALVVSVSPTTGH